MNVNVGQHMLDLKETGLKETGLIGQWIAYDPRGVAVAVCLRIEDADQTKFAPGRRWKLDCLIP